MTVNDNLKPCPFCGSEAELFQNRMRMWQVVCTNYSDCPACNTMFYASKKDAVLAWNDRMKHDDEL